MVSKAAAFATGMMKGQMKIWEKRDAQRKEIDDMLRALQMEGVKERMQTSRKAKQELRVLDSLDSFESKQFAAMQHVKDNVGDDVYEMMAGGGYFDDEERVNSIVDSMKGSYRSLTAFTPPTKDDFVVDKHGNRGLSSAYMEKYTQGGIDAQAASNASMAAAGLSKDNLYQRASIKSYVKEKGAKTFDHAILQAYRNGDAKTVEQLVALRNKTHKSTERNDTEIKPWDANVRKEVGQHLVDIFVSMEDGLTPKGEKLKESFRSASYRKNVENAVRKYYALHAKEGITHIDATNAVFAALYGAVEVPQVAFDETTKEPNVDLDALILGRIKLAGTKEQDSGGRNKRRYQSGDTLPKNLKRVQ